MCWSPFVEWLSTVMWLSIAVEASDEAVIRYEGLQI